ncbi:MAG: MarR family transcriptional regulator [Betaproteobacteria bacterium]|nr:MarR family transcriptional regulator [Betaproteobacteria bacterium]
MLREIEAVRRFNRFYTGRIGVLPKGYLGFPFALGEARVLFELGHGGKASASELGRALELDLGYLSRVLQSLRRRGLVHARRSAHDARRTELTLTERGRRIYAELDARSREKTGAMLSPLGKEERSRLVSALGAVQSVLSNEKSGEIVLRQHRPGDLGWVIERHGALYFKEYGWGGPFEALVAEVIAGFLKNFNPARERCWIAELDGERVGSVLIVEKTRTTAQLRMLLLEPQARGRGLGKRLVAECIAFARAKGYRKLVLWTHSNLVAARQIYRDAGFRLVKREPHRHFGARVVGEYWELEL